VVFKPLEIAGVLLIEPQLYHDERGFFARTWCQQEFKAHGLNPRFVQCSISSNTRKGTLRGMHYQIAPYREAKLVRCTHGIIYDVVIDLRPESPTFKRHVAQELSAENRHMLYVPEGVAHGFLTLADNTEVLYQMSEFWAPDYARGVRWNDPAFAISWPAQPEIIAERDQKYADFSG
jgi:dTDP-4-dehydrorhamnose 3,5-epimerase